MVHSFHDSLPISSLYRNNYFVCKNFSKWCNIGIFEPRNYFYLFVYLGTITDNTRILNFDLVQGKCIYKVLHFSMSHKMPIKDIKCDSGNVYRVYICILFTILWSFNASKSRKRSTIAFQLGFQCETRHLIGCNLI